MPQKKRYLPLNVYSLREVIRKLKIGNSYHWLQFLSDPEYISIIEQYCEYELGKHPKNGKACHLFHGTYEDIDTAYRKASVRKYERKLYKR